MARLLRHLAFLIAFGLGLSAVLLAEQAIPHFALGAAIECSFNQPAADLADANSLKVGIAYDGGTEAVSGLACSGGASPFLCSFAVPAANRGVGSHRLVYRTGTLEFDGSISFGLPVTNDFVIDPAKKGPPAQPSNSLIKIIGGLIVGAVVAIWAWLH